jgi:type II secretion system protein D
VAVVAAAATGIKPTEAQVDGVIREQISLSPDLRTNSVVVKAPTAVMEVIREIIDDLDTTSAGARGVETITLVNADARQTATLLREIFTLSQAGDTYILVPSQHQPSPGDLGADPLGPPSDTLTPVPDQRQQLSIAVDARTNSIIVSGTEEYLERVVTIVKDLDAKQGTERENRVYAIRNTKAKDLETTLQSYFRGEAEKRDVLNPNQVGSAQRQLEQEVTVVGDEKSNKLIISTSPRYMDMVLGMVEELDAAPPQVHIQVLLAEITTDTNGQWGFDFRAREVGGKNFNIMSTAAGVGVAAALGLPNLTFASSDFDFIIRALEAQGKLQVLSSPYLQARNNEPASIQVGDNIAIVEGNTQITPQGGTIAAVTRKDIGIILNVTPSISPDGFVRMEVAPEISSLSARTTQVTAELQAPIIAQRKVKTTVTVKDGQTVVIGGLLQTQTDVRRTKVPLLGDIPIVGWLFRTKENSDVKTELLVILTPKVIYSDTPEGEETQRRVLNQKVEASESPQMIREAMTKNGNFEQSPIDLPPEPEAVPPPPAPPTRRPTYPGEDGIYRPSSRP